VAPVPGRYRRRDIYYDQKHRDALVMRQVLEAIITHPQGIEPETLTAIQHYTKLYWVNNGPYNNLTARKFVLALPPETFAGAARKAAQAGASFPTAPGESLEALLKRLQPMFFDPAVDPIVTNKTPGPGKDILTASANNLYVGVSQKDIAQFKERYGLNSRLVKKDGRLVEEVYRIDGRYGKEIAADRASPRGGDSRSRPSRREGAARADPVVRTGEDADRAKYDIAWVEDKDSPVDTINGFIEVYLDPRGSQGFVRRAGLLREQGKDRPHPEVRRERAVVRGPDAVRRQVPQADVKGIVANAIDVVVETGDSGPVTPVGINLPNDQRIRESTAASRSR
jgi:dipeptidyl-peptidase-3